MDRDGSMAVLGRVAVIYCRLVKIPENDLKIQFCRNRCRAHATKNVGMHKSTPLSHAKRVDGFGCERQ